MLSIIKIIVNFVLVVVQVAIKKKKNNCASIKCYWIRLIRI